MIFRAPDHPKSLKNLCFSYVFPESVSVGFSLCRLTAGVELRAALVEVTRLLDRDFHSKPRLISSLDMDFCTTSVTGTRRPIESLFKSCRIGCGRGA